MTHIYLFTFLPVLLVLIFSANGNAQTSSSPLRFDREIMEMIKIVTKKPEDSRNRSTFTPSKQLKPAHEVWIQWEQIKASEKSLQKVVNADTPVAELKILAEKGNQDAVTFLREYLQRLTVDENTSETMLKELAEIEHKESLRILQEQKDTRAAKQKAEQEAKRKAEEEQKRLQEERKKIEEEKARLAKEKEDARKLQEEIARLKAQEEANRLQKYVPQQLYPPAPPSVKVYYIADPNPSNSSAIPRSRRSEVPTTRPRSLWEGPTPSDFPRPPQLQAPLRPSSTWKAAERRWALEAERHLQNAERILQESGRR